MFVLHMHLSFAVRWFLCYLVHVLELAVWHPYKNPDHFFLARISYFKFAFLVARLSILYRTMMNLKFYLRRLTIFNRGHRLLTRRDGTIIFNSCIITLVKRVYGAWEHVYLPLLSFSIHIEQRHVSITVLFNIWFKTVNNYDIYCIDNVNNPPIMFFVSNITFSGVRIFTRNIYFNCTDISDTGVQMFLRTNDKNNYKIL